MTDRLCHGCDDTHPDVTDYAVLDNDGRVHSPVPYCGDCAELARMNWNGTTVAIVEADALFKASDNPEPFGPTDIADLGSPEMLVLCFGLPVGGSSGLDGEAVERVR